MQERLSTDRHVGWLYLGQAVDVERRGGRRG